MAFKSVRTRLAEMIEGEPPIMTNAVAYSLVGVYRRRNSENIVALNPPAGSTYLWALDEIAPELSEMTVGVGPGNRFELVNRLLKIRAEHDDWLVVVDDDVQMTRGNLSSAVAIAELADFDLCGISHSRWSYLNWSCTLHQYHSIARLMHYVEQGPCVILSPGAQLRLIPFPEDLGMGWGIEFLWAEHKELRLGILDAVHLRHLNPVERSSYDVDAEWAQASLLQSTSKFARFSEIQQTIETWKYGQTGPPWHIGERP